MPTVVSNISIPENESLADGLGGGIIAPLWSTAFKGQKPFRLADELQRFLVDRLENPNRPPVAMPDSREPNPSDERKRAIKLSQDYAQATFDMYMRTYKDRMVGIIKEYESKGIPTGYLESDVRQQPPYLAIGTAAEGKPSDELFVFRNLSYRVDAYDNAIYIPY